MRRSLSPIALGTICTFALVTAGCGDDTADPVASDPPADLTNSDSLPPVDDADGYDRPTGADEVIVKIASEGGFVPIELVFANLPTLLVAGDGATYTNGPVLAIYPGPLLPNVIVQTATEAGVDDLLALADEFGLLQERTYAGNDMIADASDTVVTIAVDGEVYEHRAYALGIGGPDGEGETDPDRKALADFVAVATGEWLSADNPELGAQAPYPAETYLVRATPVTDMSGYDIEPTVVDWPAGTGLALADAAECAEVSAASVADAFADANQLTFFTDAGVTYSLAVKPLLPGDGC